MVTVGEYAAGIDPTPRGEGRVVSLCSAWRRRLGAGYAKM